MKVARLFGITLVAVFALGAMLASTASAIPKFKLPITNRAFLAVSGLSILRAPAEKISIDCIDSHTVGTILGDDEVDAVIHFLGCTVAVNGGTCSIKSVGAPGEEGLIITNLLKGLLGLLHSPNNAAGILFEPSANHIFVTLAATNSPCSTIETAVEGSVAGLFSPTGKLQSTALISLAPTSATGKQEVTLILTLAGVVKPKLTSFGAAESTQEQDAVVTFAEAVEVD